MEKKGFFAEWKADLPAGLVVYLVALPLCLGIAAASTGRPDLLFSGIIAGIAGGIVVGIFSGSQLGVSGPAAGLVTIVSAGITAAGSFEAFLLAVVLAGVLQVIAGYLKAGIIGHYFPSSVIKGMLAAIGIILILKQLPHALGYDKDLMGDMDFAQKDGHNTFSELYYALKYNSTGAIIISVVSLALLLVFDMPFMKRIALFTFLPGSLIVVILGILINLAFMASAPHLALSGDHLVQLPVAESPSEFLKFFTFPDFSQFTNLKVYEIAVTLAIVASLESLLSVEATDKLDPYKRNTPTNRELKAQGMGNIVSGLLGGLPVTQVIVRSSANINSGGRTKLSTIVHGIILLLSAIIIPKYLNYIPMASLAAILLLVGYKLARVPLLVSMFRLGWEQFIPFAATIIAIIATDLLRGILIGMFFAIFFILRKNYKHSYHYNKETHSEGEAIRLVLSEEVTFLNKGSILQTLHNLPEDSRVIIDGSNSVNIDYDVAEAIYEFKNHSAALKNIQVELVDIPENEKVRGH
ncbi:MAG: SulP family inorganic anion transporter [Chitinophagales bacterium]|nr:SulP family inorganic anion transporter [Chitinophagales bacterium]